MRFVSLVTCIIVLSAAAFGSMSGSAGKEIVLSGSVFDPSGFLVVGARIKVVNKTGFAKVTDSSSSGIYSLPLPTGIYQVEISKPGFLSVRFPEFFVVNSTTGRLSMDFVLFPGLNHSPCGYSGADCLPDNLLIESHEILYSPSLRRLVKDFGPKEMEQKGKP